jgi:hypothetical protein
MGSRRGPGASDFQAIPEGPTGMCPDSAAAAACYLNSEFRT